MKMRFFFIICCALFARLPQAYSAESLMVADFERWPNNVSGEVGVYGGGEPDWDQPVHSWFYAPETRGYNPENVKNGIKSFRLVNAMKPNSAIWATFAIDLGPTLAVDIQPKKIQSLDVSAFRYLTFWVRGETGGEYFKVVFRDANALSYLDEVGMIPLPRGTPTKWTYVKIHLSKIQRKVNLKKLNMVGVHFGRNVGNPKGAIIYVDDFVFTKE